MGRRSIAPEYILRHCFCRFCSRSGRSGNWWSRSTTTCCSAGSSATDPDARSYKKSYGKGLAYLGHALVENRNDLIAAAMATTADGCAEREAALLMLEKRQQGRSGRITLGADKAFG